MEGRHVYITVEEKKEVIEALNALRQTILHQIHIQTRLQWASLGEETTTAGKRMKLIDRLIAKASV